MKNVFLSKGKWYQKKLGGTCSDCVASSMKNNHSTKMCHELPKDCVADGTDVLDHPYYVVINNPCAVCTSDKAGDYPLEECETCNKNPHQEAQHE